MIEHDRISEGFIILAVFIYVYLFTIAGSALVLFPLVLMIAGIVLHRFTSHKKGDLDDFDDTSITNEHLWKNFIFYTVLALFGVFLVNEAITVLPLTMNTGLTGWYAFLFEALMGIAEEEFFRGFVTDYFLTTLPNAYGAILLSATFFTVYHFAVYGTVISNLLYVFAGGCILSWTAYRTLHVSPCMSGHVLNNVGAYFTQTREIPAMIVKLIR